MKGNTQPNSNTASDTASTTTTANIPKIIIIRFRWEKLQQDERKKFFYIHFLWICGFSSASAPLDLINLLIRSDADEQKKSKNENKPKLIRNGSSGSYWDWWRRGTRVQSARYKHCMQLRSFFFFEYRGGINSSTCSRMQYIIHSHIWCTLAPHTNDQMEEVTKEKTNINQILCWQSSDMNGNQFDFWRCNECASECVVCKCLLLCIVFIWITLPFRCEKKVEMRRFCFFFLYIFLLFYQRFSPIYEYACVLVCVLRKYNVTVASCAFIIT